MTLYEEYERLTEWMIADKQSSHVWCVDIGMVEILIGVQYVLLDLARP